MTSVLRSTKGAKSLPFPEPVCLISYGDSIPVPFYFDKTKSAIDVKFVNGFSASTTVNGDDEDRWMRAHVENGQNLILELGSNFQTWYETAYGADAGSVKIYEHGVVAKANMVVSQFEPNNDSSFSSEETIPISYESANGDETNDYFATLLFKKPLVITYTKSGTRYYRGFATLWSEGNT